MNKPLSVGYLTTGWTKASDGQKFITGTSWQRCLQPAIKLHENLGWNVVVAPAAYLAPSGIELIGWDDLNYGNLDILVIQEWTNKSILDIVEHAQKTGTKVIMDSDDLIWGLDPKHIAYEFHKPNPDQEVNSYHWTEAIKMVDGVTCASEYLYNEIKNKYNERTFLVRSAIEPKNFKWKKERRPDTHVGWVGALPWRSGDVEKLAPFMQEYLIKHNFRFRHIGYLQASGSIHSRMQISRSLLDETAQVLPVDLPYFLPSIDIGVVPLKYCPFNYAKCLDKDTLVCTKNGFKKIKDLNINESIWNGEKFVRVEAVSQELRQTGLKIKTKLGYKIILTKNHRLMLNKKWIFASDINIGDSIELSNYSFPSKDIEIRLPLWQTRQSKQTVQFGGNDGLSLPVVKVDQILAELIGFFVGDGSCTKNVVCISCDGQDEDVVDRVGWLFNQIGLYSSCKTKTMYDGTVLRQQAVTAASRKFLDFLEVIGVADQASEQKLVRKRLPSIPNFIWNSSKPIVRAFLRGYFEADGTVNGTGASVCSKDKELIIGVQQLLLGFGITSKLTWFKGNDKYKKNIYWNLYLRRAETDIFQREIGFISNRKNNKLSEICSKTHSNAYKPVTLSDEVIKIEVTELDPIDIQVEGEKFIANGFISHNSYIKGLEYACTGIPFVAHATPEYKYLDTGIVARTQDDFLQGLERLADPNEWESVRLKQLQRVEDFNINKRWKDWYDCYARVIGGR